LKIDINFTQEAGYNQKINIEYPKDATDLMEMFGAFVGTAIGGQNVDSNNNAITPSPVPGIPQ